ncbi:MAG: DUF3329 domain-containing protein [Hyphomicrobiales bacterium]|jgi:hypothetical protein|nr:DUF3329 domain-containing protein [Hyphomicrobiales bacterium]MCO5081509.1 DUF3329 domain-containing protein [Rhizobiaceae bacterium]
MRDNEHPFFRPLWRRILLVAVCVGWSIFEFSMDAPTWGYIALAFAAYGAWQFLLNYKPPAEQPPAAKPEE